MLGRLCRLHPADICASRQCILRRRHTVAPSPSSLTQLSTWSVTKSLPVATSQSRSQSEEPSAPGSPSSSGSKDSSEPSRESAVQIESSEPTRKTPKRNLHARDFPWRERRRRQRLAREANQGNSQSAAASSDLATEAVNASSAATVESKPSPPAATEVENTASPAVRVKRRAAATPSRLVEYYRRTVREDPSSPQRPRVVTEFRRVLDEDPTAKRVYRRFLDRLEPNKNGSLISRLRQEEHLRKKYKLSREELIAIKRDGYIPPRAKYVRFTGNQVVMMEVVFLGTSAGTPTTLRNVSSTLLRMDGESWLFDCGEGTTRQMMNSSIKPHVIRRIFITHLHADHVLGLVGALLHLGSTANLQSQEKHSHPFTDIGVTEIYGPAGLRTLLRTNLELLRVHAIFRRWRVHELLRPGELPEVGERLGKEEERGRDIYCGDRGEAEEGIWRGVVGGNGDEGPGGITVDAAAIKHTIPCLGYVIREPKKREKFDMAKLGPVLEKHADEIKSMGYKVPRAVLSKLESSREPITLPQSGVTLQPPALSLPGRTVAILGDTSDPSRLLDLFPRHADGSVDGPDVLVHEATGTSLPDAREENVQAFQEQMVDQIKVFAKELVSTNSSDVDIFAKIFERLPRVALGTRAEEIRQREKMKERGHSTARMAGEFAARLGAKLLVLNHVSARGPAPWSGVRPPLAIDGSEFDKHSKTSKGPDRSAAHGVFWRFPDHPSGAQLISRQRNSSLARCRAIDRLDVEEGKGRTARFIAELAWVRGMEREAEEAWRTAAESKNGKEQKCEGDAGSAQEAKPRVVAAWDFLSVLVPTRQKPMP